MSEPTLLSKEERSMGLADWLTEAERRMQTDTWECPKHGLQSIYIEHELGDTTVNAYCNVCVSEYIARYELTLAAAEARTAELEWALAAIMNWAEVDERRNWKASRMRADLLNAARAALATPAVEGA